jgi:hypothetical protein
MTEPDSGAAELLRSPEGLRPATRTPVTIVICGDVVNGLGFWGPFFDTADQDAHENAMEWAEDNARDTDWVIADLADPTVPGENMRWTPRASRGSREAVTPAGGST